MAKVQIKDLENLVLEGGGAKGAAYAGAIRSIEKKLAKLYQNKISQLPPKPKAILDYGEYDSKGKFHPQVKRMAGASAGAITTFALALGLDSDLIEEASKFKFKVLLQDLDQGKYRMVNEQNEIWVGEDKWKSLGRGDGSEIYGFNLVKHHKVKASPLKVFFRGQIVKIFKNILINGVLQFFANVKGFFQTLFGFIAKLGGNDDGGSGIDFEPDMWGSISFMLKHFLNLQAIDQGTATISNSPLQIIPGNAPPANSPQFDIYATKIFNELIDFGFRKINRSGEMNIGLDAVANLIWDRGLFSGFKVREFFYDMMIFACLHPTHFQRSIFESEYDQAELLEFQKRQNMTMEKGRTAVDWSTLNSGIKDRLERLPQMTFQEFKDATNVSLTLCVSNYTTDEAVYFSDMTTPDFPVMEAVGASMSIPPAIKPVYNEGNAVRPRKESKDLYKLPASQLGKKSKKKKEYFDQMQYEIDKVAIKKFLAKKFNLAMDTNTLMNFSSHHLLMANLLNTYKDRVDFKTTVEVEGKSVQITYDHLVFHYNAAFKGQLLDGGYKNNIPYNVFRNMFFSENPAIPELDPLFEKTLAIKLDDTFPKEWIMETFDLFEPFQDEMKAKKYFKKRKRHFFGNILKRKLLGTPTLDETAGKDIFSKEELQSLNIESFEHIADAVIEIESKMRTKNRTPWNRQKSILGFFEGYSTGANQGQIRYLSDHEHIVPLYSYGIGTYDFNMEPIRPLIDLAIAKSEQRIDDYFPEHLITPL